MLPSTLADSTSAAAAKEDVLDDSAVERLEEGANVACAAKHGCWRSDGSGADTAASGDASLQAETDAGSDSRDTSSQDFSQSQEVDSAEAPATTKARREVGEALREAGGALRAWLYPLSKPGGSGGGGTPRLEALDAMRWVASIQIVVYHMYPEVEGLKDYATWFATWTQLFFLLSGFVLAYAELAKPPKTGSGRPSLLQYIRRRLTVIYPAFFLSLLLKVTYAPGQTAFQWWMLPLHGLLMQSWLPICQSDGGHVSCSPWMYNGEAWFLSVLLVYWLALRPLAEFFRRRSLRFSSATLLACWLFSFIFQLLGSHDRLAEWLGCTSKVCTMTIMVAIRSTPLGYAHVFVAGVAAARVFMLTAMRDADTGARITPDTRRVTLVASSAPLVLRFGCCAGYLGYAALLLFATAWIKPYYYFFHNGGVLPIMVLILIGAAIGTDPITTWLFRSKPMLVLGRISYMQYLMQHVLQGWVRQAFGWDGNAAAQALFVPCLLLFSYCCQRWVERPYTEYQRWRQEKGVKGFEDRCIQWLENRGLSVLP